MQTQADDFQGVIVPVITPYHTPDIFPVIDSLLAGGVTNIFLLGTTGEALKLSTAQRKKLIKEVSTYIGERARLLIGITCEKMADTLELMQLSHESKAFASVIAPAVLSADCASIIENLLEKGHGNLFLYNYPGISEGRSIPVDHIVPFMFEKRVLGIKDSSKDLVYFDKILRKRKDKRFKIFYGPEDNLLEAFKRDIDGFVPGTGNIAPKLAVDLWEKRENGPWNEWLEVKAEMRRKDETNYIKALKIILMERGTITSSNCWDEKHQGNS